jgi:hypothetical protein
MVGASGTAAGVNGGAVSVVENGDGAVNGRVVLAVPSELIGTCGVNGLYNQNKPGGMVRKASSNRDRSARATCSPGGMNGARISGGPGVRLVCRR